MIFVDDEYPAIADILESRDPASMMQVTELIQCLPECKPFSAKTLQSWGIPPRAYDRVYQFLNLILVIDKDHKDGDYREIIVRTEGEARCEIYAVTATDRWAKCISPSVRVALIRLRW